MAARVDPGGSSAAARCSSPDELSLPSLDSYWDQINMNIYEYIYIYEYIWIYIYIYFFIYLFIYWFFLSIYLSIYLFIYLLIYSCVCMVGTSNQSVPEIAMDSWWIGWWSSAHYEHILNMFQPSNICCRISGINNWEVVINRPLKTHTR